MTYEEFRQWALDSSRGAALRWEEPHDDERFILLAADDYDAHHVIPMPPAYLAVERGHVHWLKGALPDIVANRSLQLVAFRTSAWVSRDPRFADNPVDDPRRTEMLLLDVAEKGRYEAWHAPISRGKSRLPRVGEWELVATDKDGLSGALPKYIRKALDRQTADKGPTMPAADMVLGPWDVPYDMFPVPTSCGPIDFAQGYTVSTYIALFRPESPGPVILSQAFVFPGGEDGSEYAASSLEAIIQNGNKELVGPPLGIESHYFEGHLDNGRLRRYTALWRYDGILCELAVAGPRGAFHARDLHHYAAIQDRRVQANQGYSVA